VAKHRFDAGVLPEEAIGLRMPTSLLLRADEII
jgi:hypothetical protein